MCRNIQTLYNFEPRGMAVQAIVSLGILGLVIVRAVNVFA
jgi:hypothetical protein